MIAYHMLKNQQGIVSLRIGHEKLAKRASSLRCGVVIDFLWKRLNSAYGRITGSI